MTEQDLINLVGGFAVNNWQYLVGGLFASFAAIASISWAIAGHSHQKEIKILELELDHQKERFGQFETIMQNKLELIESQANALKIQISKEENKQIMPIQINDKNQAQNQNESTEYNPENGQIKIDYKKLMSFLLDKSDSISNTIITASRLLH